MFFKRNTTDYDKKLEEFQGLINDFSKLENTEKDEVLELSMLYAKLAVNKSNYAISTAIKVLRRKVRGSATIHDKEKELRDILNRIPSSYEDKSFYNSETSFYFRSAYLQQGSTPISDVIAIKILRRLIDIAHIIKEIETMKHKHTREEEWRMRNEC